MADALGGTITYSGGYTIHTFTSSGIFIAPSNNLVKLLVVGAGGSGAPSDVGGGGGAGGYQYNASFLCPGGQITVTVGLGVTNDKGQDSVFATVTAYGGGRGSNTEVPNSSCNGGSGGGGWYKSDNAPGTASQGYRGGYGRNVLYKGGGGGGAGAVGYDANHATYPGKGGVGISNSITGSSIYYCGGGGAGQANSSGTSGGLGGGGAGNINNGAAGTPGTANTGGGGGGAYTGGAGKGGSGIVIVSYLTGTFMSGGYFLTNFV